MHVFLLKYAPPNKGYFQPEDPILHCDCVIVVFSVTDSSSLVKAETILQQLWQSGNLNTKVVIVVGNKVDLVRTRVVPIHGKCLNYGRGY